MESLTIKSGDDVVSALQNLSIAAIPPPQETSPTAAQPKSVFSFLDSPSFQEADSTAQPESVFSFLDSPSFQEADSAAVDYSGGYYENADYGYAGFPTTYSFLQMATDPETSKVLRDCIGDGMYVRETFAEVFPYLFQLMSDRNGFPVFQTLLRSCAYSDLKLILEKFLLERDSFALTALCESGSRAIQSFIKKLKNTGMENDLTSLIAESGYLFMTHKFANHVVKQCFEVLRDEPNKPLYNIMFLLFHHLAVDPVGYTTINSAVDNVSGRERFHLLVMVVKNALQLSFDPYGNYIVQHCLELRSDEVSKGICLALRGEFVELARKRKGSFVVEKCLECSEFGRNLVLSEIFKDDKTLLMLARDYYANYPIQMALEVTKIHDEATYDRLVKVLQPRFDNLITSALSGKRRTRKDATGLI